MSKIKKIQKSLDKFELSLSGRTVLTEAATGNYVVTPVIAALAGAKVYAFTKSSRFGTIEEVTAQTTALADIAGVNDKIRIITDYTQLDLDEVDILTNTGFNRPITKDVLGKLKSGCVIPLMWEPWEFRPGEIDLEYAFNRGIKVYGTNEADTRLRTFEYIGYIALYHILDNKKSPLSSDVLVLGNEKFADAVADVLRRNGYNTEVRYSFQPKLSKDVPEVVVLAEHEKSDLLIGNENAFISSSEVDKDTLVVHICGNVDFTNLDCKYTPEIPAKFGYMSYTTDFIDDMAVIDLHTAGLKVAEGMLSANKLALTPPEYKSYMERNYPALSFDVEKYW